MINKDSFKSLEVSLERANQLIKKLNEKNEKYPGFAVGEVEYDFSKAILQETNEALAEVLSHVSSAHFELSSKISREDMSSAIQQAYKLLYHIYDDVKQIKTEYDSADSQRISIKQLNIHLQKFTKHSEQTRDHLFDVVNTLNEPVE